MRDQLPLLLGVVPFGLIYGALAVSAGVPPLAAQGFSLVIFAGSAQFIAATMVGSGALPGVIVFTILIVNLRHALYSASLAPHLAHLPRRWKLALSWLLTDEAFAIASARYRRGELGQAHWYLLGTGMTLWASWQVSTSLGIALGHAS
jgi:4-azaleucine resistance transporter AzlC